MKRIIEGNRFYEGLFLFDPNEAGKGVDALTKSVREVIDKHGAEVTHIEHWGDRKLAYEINGLKRGTYVLCYFKADPAKIVDMDRDFRLNEVFLRHLVILHEKEPDLRPEPEEGETTAAEAPVAAASS